MPLPLPDLDTRRWTDLTDEARTLIQRLAPGWTDHNVHDPGITVVELIAWLVEQDIYRLNRIPERHRRKLLRLLGFVPAPPTPARTALSVVHAGAPETLPAGAELAPADRPDLPFRTLAPLTVHGLALTVVQSFDGASFVDLTRSWRTGDAAAPWGANPAASHTTTEADPAVYLGFDRPPPAGEPVSLWLAFGGGGADRAERARPAPDTPHHGVGTTWEYHDGTAWHELTPEGGQVVDETRGFTLDGPVVVTMPVLCAETRVADVPAYYLRCRLGDGRPDAAPMLRAAAVDAVEVEQVSARDDVSLGHGDATPEQGVTAPGAPIAYGTVDLRTVQNSTVTPWELRADLDASGRRDPHVTVDAMSGRLAFGDGEHGRVVPAGAKIIASYRVTAAAMGNIAAGQTWRPATGADIGKITNVVPAEGGAAEEDLEHVAGRAAEALWAHDRLVELAAAGRSETLDQVNRVAVRALAAPERATTLLDVERLALDVPGTQVARARAWAAIDPAYAGLSAPGTVTVVIVPYLPNGRPEPTPGLLTAVSRHLDAHRIIATRLLVVGPSYLDVRVRATVAVAVGADPARVQHDVTDAVNGFLDPLRGGPRRQGWPFGRDVYRTEVLQVIAGVPGVDHVRELELMAGDGDGSCGNLCVPETWLVAPGRHEITMGRGVAT